MKRLKLPILVSLALTLVALPLMAPHAEAAAKILKIGTIFPLTGPAAPGMGPEATDGVRLAADWVNDKGGITVKGEKYRIEIVAEDNRSTSEGTIAAANKLVYDHKVKFVCGPIIPWLSIAMAPISEEAKVLRCLVDGTGTPQEMNPKLQYTFSPFFEFPQIPPMYDYLTKNHPEVKKLAIVDPDEPGGQFFLAATKKEAESRGIEVVHTETYPFGTEDFYPIWTKILARKADAVEMGVGIPPWYAAIIKQGRELGFTGPIFTSSAIPDVPVLIALVGKEYANNIFSVTSNLYAPELPPLVEEVKRRVTDKYGRETVEAHLGGWDALWCMVQAIEEAGSIDTTVVAKTWEKMKSIETLHGTGTMGGQETYGINHVVMRPLVISKLVNGKVETVGYFKPRFPELP